MEQRKFNPFMPLWFALVLAGGVLLGAYIGGGRSNPFAGGGKSDKFEEVLKWVSGSYVDTVSREALEEKAIAGLLQGLDPHSVYISAREFHEANDPLVGSFEGIGVQFRIEHDTITVINTISGGPSEKIGIRAGDRIVEIDGNNVAGIKISTTDVMRKLKGPKGTRVDVSVFRRGAGGLIDFTITRDVIPTYSMDIAYMIEPGTGYIRLNNFSATTAEEVHNALVQLKEHQMNKLILDLRGNGGGYLQAAVEVSDEFLPKGKLIVYTEGTNHPREMFYAKGDGLFQDGELVVLIDEWSASSSEIVAGAIQDNDRGTIMGRRSFGKGLVQEQQNFRDGSAVRLTVARYYTPTGRCIQRPYDNGTEEYNNEYYHRYVNGEMENPDSIQFADSLRYTTPGGKTVYGGGGIMPDVYVPMERDSTLVYYNLLVNRGIIYQYAFDYTDRNRASLNRFASVEEFENGFQITPAIYEDFIAFADKKGVKRQGAGLQEADRRAKILMKAYIGRNILDNEGFYPILNTMDQTIKKALGLVNKS